MTHINQTKPRVLVTSAAGHTGSTAVLELLKKGFPVRAFVRKQDYRSERLEKAGAEIFVGDLFNMNDLRRSLIDVQRAYHCPPFAAHLLHGSMLFALAAEEAKLEVVVLMSAWNPHPGHPGLATREHWIVNNVFRWMPSVDVIHLNPGLFAFTYFLGLPAMVHFGMLVAPWGNGLNAPPSNEDIGCVAAELIAAPKDRVGQSYRPTGPKLISPQDVASTLSTVIGRKVKYQDAPPKMLIKATTAQGFSNFEITHIRHFIEELKQGAFAVGGPTGHVEEICGRPPEDFASIAKRYVAQPDLILPGFKVGNKFQAIGFMIKLMMTRVADLDGWEKDQGYPQIKGAQLAHDNSDWMHSANQQKLLLQT